MGNIKRELVAASSKMIVLSILMMEDNYGYSILESIKTFTKGSWEWKEGMLYPGFIRWRKTNRSNLIGKILLPVRSGNTTISPRLASILCKQKRKNGRL